MKERPILFSAPMVRALLAGTKTQTRRIVKPQPTFAAKPVQLPSAMRCPYGADGDRLWVRETFARRSDTDDGTPKAKRYVMYQADGGSPRDPNNWHDYGGRWLPSIHMPRWASRITLEVTDVRVERLLDISEADAISEGVFHHPQGHWKAKAGDGTAFPSAIGAYTYLWQVINGDGSWDANPWVWVIGFRTAP